MIRLVYKQEIILVYIRDGKSQRKISKETGIARDTVRKYLAEYESKVVELAESTEGDEITKTDIIDEIIMKPNYKSCSRVKKALTEAVVERIRFYLKENEIKRLSGLPKQQKKKKDIYEALLNEGYNLSMLVLLRR